MRTRELDRRTLLLGAAATALAGLRLVPAASAADRRLASLQRAVRGPVYVPQSDGYGRARLLYQERFDAVHPLAVVQPVSAGDIAQIVRWARRTGVRLSIRSGGHSYGGYSTGPGLVVDLRRLRALHLNRSSGIVTIGAGSRLIDVEAHLAPSGRAIPSGSCPSVGIGGLALGGGVGFLSRQVTTSDNVVSLRIVTADGRSRICDHRRNADLFWACRGGGGGNFGIVTSFEVRSHAVPDVVSRFFVDWPWSQAAEVIGAWQRFAPHAPDGLFSICSSSTGPGGPSIRCFGQFLGSEPRLRGLLEPLLHVDGAAPSLTSSTYLESQLVWAGCGGKTVDECRALATPPVGSLSRGSFLAKSDYLSAPLTSAGIATIRHWMEHPPAGGAGTLLLDSYGAALNRVAPDATAFVHRNALCSAQYIAPVAEASAAWLRSFHAAMRPHVSGFAYQNYIDRELTTWRHAYYGTNYPRLVKIKHEVDPERLFRFAQAIGS